MTNLRSDVYKGLSGRILPGTRRSRPAGCSACESRRPAGGRRQTSRLLSGELQLLVSCSFLRVAALQASSGSSRFLRVAGFLRLQRLPRRKRTVVDEVTKHERDSSQGRRAAARLRSGAGVRSARLGWGVEGVRLGLCYWAGP